MLPSALRMLVLTSEFNQPFQPGSLPDGLTVLARCMRPSNLASSLPACEWSVWIRTYTSCCQAASLLPCGGSGCRARKYMKGSAQSGCLLPRAWWEEDDEDDGEADEHEDESKGEAEEEQDAGR